ncbi:MAG: helicase-associated domain-containing protein [Pirellulales bacterium]|nr:helicase-associated domain-containing protein [Pirellulales bacterium]
MYSLNTSAIYRYSGGSDIAHSVISVAWIEEILARKEDVKKNSPRPKTLPSWLSFPRPRPEIVESAATLSVEQSLIRHLMDLTVPLPLRDLKRTFPDVAPRVLADALLRGIGDLAIFPAMRMGDMTPVLGLWPAITQRLHRPKAKSPETVQPDKSFHAAFLMEDMTTLLVAAASGSLRLRGNDYALFAKAQQEIESNMMPLFDWVADVWNLRVPARLNTAKFWLQSMGLTKNAGDAGKDLRLQPTLPGEAWLAEPPKQRLKKILDYLANPTTAKNALADSAPGYDAYGDEAGCGYDDDEDDDFDEYDDYSDYDDYDDYDEYDDGFSGFDRRLDFLPLRLESADRKDYDAIFRKAIVDAFAAGRSGEFISLDGFLRWHVEEKNPLVDLFKEKQKPRIYGRWGYRAPNREELDELWNSFLTEFLVNRLFVLGGIQLGVAGKSGEPCFSLTDIGRYLLGIGKDFDYGQGQADQGQVVVQPNFDIVFLAPSPLAEATIARFAERKTRGQGTMFAITKKSIITAAGGGMTAAQVLDTLKNVSCKPIPANVTREVTGWFNQCRKIQVRPSILIHCPDAETAARVLAAGGKKTVALTDTVVELMEAKAKTEILRKLQGSGVFVGQHNPHHHSSHHLPGSRRSLQR